MCQCHCGKKDKTSKHIHHQNCVEFEFDESGIGIKAVVEN